MPKIAATLEHDANHRGQAAGGVDSRPPRAETMKFIHASGTRPLDGYTIKRGIGAGGFGEVYFAVSDAGKEVALKRIQRNLDVEIRGVSQCLNLKHVNLVSLYDIKYDDHGDAWVVMEYVSGGSLRDPLDKAPNGMPIAEVNAWFQGIGAGVAYLHDHGIVHRDLKPGNIFSDEGVVKIGDYGLSKFISCSRRSGHTESVGTFHYMAPEIGRGSYGKEIDVYALGIILYEMLTGRVPFDGETSQEIIMKHLTASPDLTPLPMAYREVVRRALLKDPTKRYPEVSEMLAALGMNASSGGASVDTKPAPLNGHTQPYKSPLNSPANEPTPQPVPATAINPATPEPILVAELVREEPIAANVRLALRRLGQFWANLETPGRIIFGVVGGILMVTHIGLLVPLVVTFGSMYLVYFGIYSLITAVSPPMRIASPARPMDYAPMPAPVQYGEPSRQERRDVRREKRRERWNGGDIDRSLLWHRSPEQRLSDLLGGMLMSTPVIAVLSLVMLTLGGHHLDSTVETWTFFTWFGLTCVAGTWSILALSKMWELETGDQMRRRFGMLVAGLAVGAVSYGLSQYLAVNLSDAWLMRPVQGAPLKFGAHFYDSTGRPILSGFLMYFGMMFAIVRWWNLSDPLRYARVNVWDTAICAFFAWAVQSIWSFWYPWGIMIFVTIAIAVQMSSTWMSRAERSEGRV